jgi:general secretion pathway protein F
MVLLLGFVVPRFALLITDLGQEVPVSTRALLALSSLVHRLGLPALIMAAMAGGALRRVLHRPQYQRHFHRLLLRLPSIGSLRQALASARMLQALSHALSAGMALVPAMMVGQAATTDAAIAERIGQARARVERGETLSHALREERAAAPLGVQLLGVGEATGQLASMAERAARLLQMDVERRLRTLASLAEPILIIAFGLMIACVAAGLLQAVYSLRPAA